MKDSNNVFVVPIWYDGGTQKYYCHCWNCGMESVQCVELSKVYKIAHEHHLTCPKPERWHNNKRRLIGVELTFR